MNRLDFEGGNGRRDRRRRGHRFRDRAAAPLPRRPRGAVGPRRAALETAAAGLGHGTVTHALDVADPHAVEQAVAATARDFGRIDALVCSAGITGPNTDDLGISRSRWRQVIEVNINGVFLCNRAVAPSC